MVPNEYVLTGFDDFLERRRVAFVEPLPSTRICGVCGVVPCQSLLLPCGDVLCHVCKGEKGREDGTCPLDDMAFTEADIAPLTFKQCHLEQCLVLCVVGGEKCGFVGKLSELKAHLAVCVSDEVKCVKCQCTVVRGDAADHYRECCAESPSRKIPSATAISSAVEKLGGIKSDLERIQDQVSNGKVEPDLVANSANSLVERMACLEIDLIQLHEAAGGGDICDSLVPAAKRAAVTGIPFRAASKAGVFVLTCEFTDVYAAYKLLTGEKTEQMLGTDTHTLAGYTFKVECALKKEKEDEVLIHFILFLRDGAWDDWVEWPFSKKTTMIIRHPRDAEKDIRLPSRMQALNVVKKPQPGTWNRGNPTKKEKWANLELQGFILNNNLYIDVEFE